MSFKKLIREESKRFAQAPYAYTLALFLLIFGLSTCSWSIAELLEITSFSYNYSLTTIFSLALSIFTLILLNIEADKCQAKDNQITRNC
ncbi:hypothetical protein E2K93_11035 [Thalassotalea sp. HSM 43]|uniref:hypothetical protein n=1 Tax=Thalassotalea sp. HSM 43 TaxID=2552945 RepID=UPI0010806C52|nr:hypothetical protein [Thalassotalea sp. HSM 43]QBY04884.1 hypothetical protein E2K93_11035 [Thalassotalea sp. HSM 43]